VKVFWGSLLSCNATPIHSVITVRGTVTTTKYTSVKAFGFNIPNIPCNNEGEGAPEHDEDGFLTAIKEPGRKSIVK
jgi:hypothetical protein